MTKVYDTARFGESSRNVEYLGAFIAWLTVNHLLAENVERAAGSAVARVRMQDLSGPEFLTTILHGELRAAHLTDDASRFVEHYFVGGKYLKDYATCEYQGEDEWLRYDEIAPKITAAFRKFNAPRGTLREKTAKILKFPTRSKK